MKRGLERIDRIFDRKIMGKLCYFWRKRVVMIEGIFIILLIQFGLVAILVSAIATANKMQL